MRLFEQAIVPVDPEAAFAYTADFGNIRDWDPGVSDSRRIDDGPLGPGSAFALTVAFGARRIPMTYTITGFDPPHRVVLEGEGATLRAVDEISFAAGPQGTVITYTADLEFKGIFRLVAPFLGSVLRGVGRKAVAGLAEALSRAAQSEV